MPSTSHLTWRAVAASTVVALVASVGTYALLTRDDGTTARTAVQLTPEANLPALADATFTSFDGQRVALASLRGTPTVVNFFSSTCTPCIKEMPAFEKVSKLLGPKVTFLGLAVSDRADDAQALVSKTGVTYRTGQDLDASVITALGGTVLPTTVLLDADGKVVASHAGELSAEGLRSLIADKLGVTS